MRRHPMRSATGSSLGADGRPGAVAGGPIGTRALLALAIAVALGLALGSSLATAAAEPTISPATLWEPTQTSIQLNAFVNPHGEALTDCHFEWGAGSTLDKTAPCESPLEGDAYTPPGNEQANLVAARIAGLTPGAQYSYRLVATNGTGTVEGDQGSFHALSPATGAESCTNQAIRLEQHVTAVPGCRAYEKVSPDDKNGGDVVGDGGTVIAAVEGNAVTYSSRVGFGDTEGSGVGGQTQYVGRRGEAGWSTHAITPTPDPRPLQVFLAATVAPWFSTDLSRALLFAYDLPTVTDDVPGVVNIYGENTNSGDITTPAFSPEVTGNPFFFFNFLQELPEAASDDLGDIVFSAMTPLLPGAPSGALYDWSGGELQLASVLPDGTPAAGAIPHRPYRHSMSSDGSRLAFSSSSQLYLRIDNQRTVWLSEPEWSGAPAQPEEVDLRMLTDDGLHAFFTTSSPLLEEDTYPGPDLYLWSDTPDPTSESNLTLISHSGAVSESGEVLGAAQDGSRVYYTQQNGDFRVWDHGVDTSIGSNPSNHSGFSAYEAGPGVSRVSSDGRRLAFFSYNEGLDGEHNITGRAIYNGKSGIESLFELYVYDSVEHTLACVSCPQPGELAKSPATVVPAATAATSTLSLKGFRPNYLSSDGNTLFFSTGESLVPQDTNGVADVYRYEIPSGRLGLVTPGTTKVGVWFSDASPSGDDVFLATRAQLAPQDGDDLVDLYDARVGGGFPGPVPAPAPCSGEACQGQPSAQPPLTAPASASLSGPGNPSARRGCPRGRRAVIKHGKRRCVSAKGHRRQRRHAAEGRGGAK